MDVSLSRAYSNYHLISKFLVGRPKKLPEPPQIDYWQFGDAFELAYFHAVFGAFH
jgi:hypothetical protein